MRSYLLHEARADLSKLIDRALAGEPQRVTRRGRDAVIVVSEAEWKAAREPTGLRGQTDEPGWQPRERYGNLGELLVHFAREVGFREEDFGRDGRSERPLGADLLDN